MKVAIYTRVSTEDQAREGTSLEVQQESLLDFAHKSNHEVYKIYCDEGISGYVLERPQLQRLLNDAKNKKFDMVLVHKIDRFSRNLKNLLNLVDELEKCDVKVKSTTEFYDTSNSAGKMMFQQLGSFAEFERNKIKERVFPGMVKGVQNGNWQGSKFAPLGYSYDKGKKVLEIVPREETLVKFIYELYLSGLSTGQITQHLHEKGYESRTGKVFYTKYIRDILRNNIYTGKIVWNKYHYTEHNTKRVKNDQSKWVTGIGKHEAIISQKDFDAVQRKLENNRRGGVTRAISQCYILTGIIYCSNCKRRYYGINQSFGHEIIDGEKVKKKRRYYRCSAKSFTNKNCGNSYVIADILEEEILEIVKIAITPFINNGRKQLLLKSHLLLQENSDNLSKKLTEAKEKLKENLSIQERLSFLYAQKLLAIEAYKNQYIPLDNEINKLKMKIAEYDLQLAQKERSEEYEHLIKLIANRKLFDDKKDKLPDEDIKLLLKFIFKQVLVEDGKLKEFELYEPFQSSYKGDTILCQPIENKRVAKVSPYERTAAK